MAVHRQPVWTRRFFTKWRGGLSVTEIGITLLITFIAIVFLGESIPSIVFGLAMGVVVAWNSRKLPTMYRDVRVWMLQGIYFVVGRAYPFAQRRLMNNKLRVPRTEGCMEESS